jgi:hypothetical protein
VSSVFMAMMRDYWPVVLVALAWAAADGYFKYFSFGIALLAGLFLTLAMDWYRIEQIPLTTLYLMFVPLALALYCVGGLVGFMFRRLLSSAGSQPEAAE